MHLLFYKISKHSLNNNIKIEEETSRENAGA